MKRKPQVTATPLGNPRLWNTYMYWARSSLPVPLESRWRISNETTRIRADRAKALQGVVFAAFVLEYRLRASYEFVKVKYNEGDTLGKLLKAFKGTIEKGRRHDNGAPIVLSPEWSRVLKRLWRLVRLRNNVAHAKYTEVRKLLHRTPHLLQATGCRCYNAVIDAIRVIDLGIGYETQSPGEARRYYDTLKVRFT